MKKKIVAILLGLILAVSAGAGFYRTVQAETGTMTTVEGSITVDGSLDDWDGVPQQTSTDGEISWWKAARDASGNLYVCFTGEASTQWYGNYNWKYLTLNQNSSDWTKNGFQITNTENFSGGTLAAVNTANGNTAGPYYVELMVPASYFESDDVTVSFAGTSLSYADVPVLNGTDVTPEKDDTYHGITIDGSFDDWNGVTKYDAVCPNPDHPECISEAAMVFDGNSVFIYVKDGAGGTAAGAGSHSNGNYAITTDLGNQLLLHFQQDGSVTSETASGIVSRHVGSEWEVSVPADQLPGYSKTISFGLYTADSSDPAAPFVKDVANLQGGGGNTGSFSGISYDGSYEDWESYPHTLIEYATAGTQSELPDGEGALYGADGRIYGHAFTEMAAHLSEHGSEFAYALSIRLNQNDGTVFYPRLISVSSDGTVNWNPSFSDGQTAEYYIVDTQGWSSARTLTELESGNYGNSVFGKITITADSSNRDECEFYLDDAALAQKFGMGADDLQYVEAQFGRIGQQWIGTAGTSSGPFAGVALCVGITAAVLFRRKKKGGRTRTGESVRMK